MEDYLVYRDGRASNQQEPCRVMGIICGADSEEAALAFAQRKFGLEAGQKFTLRTKRKADKNDWKETEQEGSVYEDD